MEAFTRHFLSFYLIIFLLSFSFHYSDELFYFFISFHVWGMNTHTHTHTIGCCCCVSSAVKWRAYFESRAVMTATAVAVAAAVVRKIKLILWQLSELNSWKLFKITAHKKLHIVLSAKNVGLSVFHDANMWNEGDSYA